MTQPQEIGFVCPHCGAPNHEGAVECSLCGRVLAVVAPKAMRDEHHDPNDSQKYPPTSSRTFSIGSLLLAIALIAVWLGIVRSDLWLILASAVLAVPAFARTMVVVGRCKAQGLSLNDYEKVGTFFFSFVSMAAIVVVVGLSCFAAFFVVGIATSKADSYGYPFVGAAVGLAVFFFFRVIKSDVPYKLPKGNRR